MTSEYLEFPHPKEAIRMPGHAARQRMRTELCIAVQEDYGWREWLWFPGRSASATAHWWVLEGGPGMIGELYQPKDKAAYRLYEALSDVARCIWVHGDMAPDSYMVLPRAYEVTLVPNFAVGTANARWHGHGNSTQDDEWLTELSRWVARHSAPEHFLSRLRLACKHTVRGGDGVQQ